jgi:hypothetical protein
MNAAAVTAVPHRPRKPGGAASGFPYVEGDVLRAGEGDENGGRSREIQRNIRKAIATEAPADGGSQSPTGCLAFEVATTMATPSSLFRFRHYCPIITR